MTETVTITKKLQNVWPWVAKGIITILIAILGWFGKWAFETINTLEERTARMEIQLKDKQNEEQWLAINDNRNRIQDTETKSAVTAELLRILVDKDKIDIRTIELEKKETQVLKNLPTLRREYRSRVQQQQILK